MYPQRIQKVPHKYSRKCVCPKSIPGSIPESISAFQGDIRSMPKCMSGEPGARRRLHELCRNVCLARRALPRDFLPKVPARARGASFPKGGKGNGMSVGCRPRRLYCDRILMCSGLGLRFGIPISIVLALLISAGRRNRYVLSCFFLVLVLFAAFHQNIL